LLVLKSGLNNQMHGKTISKITS